MLYEDLSKKIISGVINVHNGLGPGLLESCYQNALYYELKSCGLAVTYEAPFNVFYKGQQVGEYFADLLVEGRVILELKSVKSLGAANEAQLLNYLHLSGCRLGYLVNFQGVKAVWKRYLL